MTGKKIKNKKPVVVVLARNYATGLGIIRSLGIAGYIVDLIYVSKQKGSSVISASSKYVRNSYELVINRLQGNSGDELVELLLEYRKTQNSDVVLFPADDFTASIISKNADVLKNKFMFPEINPESGMTINDLMDKSVQSKMAQEAGINIAKQWVVSINGKIELPKEITYPCFVKPLKSVLGHKNEITVCKDSEELILHLHKMQKIYNKRKVLVQENLNISKEYDLSGLCLDSDIIIPAVIEKERVSIYQKGVTITGKIVSPDVLEDSKEKLIAMLKKLHYTGMFDLEMYVCQGKIYFNEINLRSGGPNFFYYLSGVNLPSVLVSEMLGQGHDRNDERPLSYGQTFVNEKAAWDEFIHGNININELKYCLNKHDFKIMANDDDPKPGRIFEKRIRLSYLKNRIIGLFKRYKSMENKRDRAVVAGCNYSNILTMVRALDAAGYDVEVLRIYKSKLSFAKVLRRMEPEKKSLYVKSFTSCVIPPSADAMLKKLLEIKDSSSRKLLVCTDDYSLYLADCVYDKIKKYYIASNIDDTEGRICEFMHKNLQKDKASEFNIPVLKSNLIKLENGKYSIPDDIEYPCCVKSNLSFKGSKEKIRCCLNRDELLKTVQLYFKDDDSDLLVEKFVDIKNEYSLLGVSSKENVIAPALFKTTSSGNRQRKGVAAAGETVDIDYIGDFSNRCCEFLKSLGFTGLFDIDIIEDKNSNIFFTELNLRAGSSIDVFTQTGMNLPKILADFMVKSAPVKIHKEAQAGKTFVNEKVLLEEYARGDADYKKIKQMLKNSDVCFIKDNFDIGPYKYLKRFAAFVCLTRLAYKFKEK